MTGADLRAAGDRQLAESLLREPIIRKALDEFDRLAEEMGARRHLLATALRLTPEMAPDVHEIVDGCRGVLGLQAPLEVYVYPQSAFNAAAVRPERERLFLLFSSGLLEAFEPAELRFVAGHELGHHLFEHHKIPSVALLPDIVQTDPGLVLRLFAWQRYAEISADRTGLACAGGLEPAAHALFKLASGLSGGRVKVRIDQFLAQVGDFQAESERLTKAHEPVRSDWFATHPFSPLRLRAAEIFARSELVTPGGIPREQLEAEVEDVVRLMEPGYLQERSEVAEAMRRLLFAGAVLVATSSGHVDEQALAALERLLGPGAIPSEVNADAVRAQLPRWVKHVNEIVPPLRRVQVIRDLVVIACADGGIGEPEQRVLHEIASAVGVDPAVIARTEAPTSCCAPE
jgi:Zn-dependent protease with chaperone function